MRYAACLILSLVVVSCQGNDATRETGASVDSATIDSVAAIRSASPDRTARPDTGSLLALDGEGLRLVVAATGSTRLLAFGADSATVISALSVALGPATSRGTSADCGAGPLDFATFADGLSITMLHARFVGWSARASATARTLTTMSGIGVGSTRAALDSAYAATVSTTTLGEEFSAGGLAGVLDGTAASARITTLWSGTTCQAR